MPDVEIGGRFGRLYGFLDWFLRLVGLNVLWLLGVVAGVVIGGLAPATVALYALLHEYTTGRSPRMWREFWRTWRSALASAHLVLGVPILTVWVMVFYLLAARGTPFVFTMALLTLGYLATLLQLPAVIVRLDLPATQTWAVAVAVAWKRPLGTLAVITLTAVLLVCAWFTTPAAIPLLFPALPALLATLVVRRTIPQS